MTPFQIVIDTREQRSWSFGDVPTVRAALPSGDYSFLGGELTIALERKELGDFVACCTHERDRFERELERLRSYDFAAVIVEAEMGQVWAGEYHSRALPQAIIGSAAAFHVDYGVPVIFAHSRQRAADFALRILRRCHRKLIEAA